MTTKRPSRSVWKPTTRPQSPSSPSTRNAALFARCRPKRKPGSLPGVASNCCHPGTVLLSGPWFPSLVGQEPTVHCGWAWGAWLGLLGGGVSPLPRWGPPSPLTKPRRHPALTARLPTGQRRRLCGQCLLPGLHPPGRPQVAKLEPPPQ